MGERVMKWPWSKKPVQETAEITITIPKATVQEVKWKTVVGPWRGFTVCHCGEVREQLSCVCPKCGCQDEWVDHVGREEWEEEDHGNYSTILYGFAAAPVRRNSRFVAWTPDRCEVKP